MKISGNLAADREFTNSQGIVSESVGGKILSGKTVYCKLHIWGYIGVL